VDLQLRGPARALAERGTAAGAAALEARFGAPALDAAAAARRSSLSLAEPSHPPRLRMGPPPHELVLEHVHGFRGRDARGSLHALACGDLFFPAAGVCVVMDAASREQEFFSEHEREVTASAVHPGGVLVATGEAGREPLVIVWDAERMQAQARLGACSLEGLTSYGGPVRALAFSPCGARLVALGGDSHNTLVVWDWRAKTPLFGTRTGRHAVLAAAFAPRAPGVTGGPASLVVCGVQHAAFFTLGRRGRAPGGRRGSVGAGEAEEEEERLEGRSAVWGRGHRAQTLLCVAHATAPIVQSAQPRAVALAGGGDGRVYLFGWLSPEQEWRDEVLASSTAAHAGQVIDLRVDAAGQGHGPNGTGAAVASCGEDGVVRLWVLAAEPDPRDRAGTVHRLVPTGRVSIAAVLAAAGHALRPGAAPPAGSALCFTAVPPPPSYYVDTPRPSPRTDRTRRIPLAGVAARRHRRESGPARAARGNGGGGGQRAGRRRRGGGGRGA